MAAEKADGRRSRKDNPLIKPPLFIEYMGDTLHLFGEGLHESVDHDLLTHIGAVGSGGSFYVRFL